MFQTIIEQPSINTKEAQIKINAQEILNDPELKTSLETILGNIHYVNGTEPGQEPKASFEERLDRFLTGSEAGELKDFWMAMEHSNSDISNERIDGKESEEEALSRINKKLLNKGDVLKTIAAELIEAQKILLDKNDSEYVTNRLIKNEQTHITNVSTTAELFTTMPILQLILPVHDFVKHNFGYLDLGLHEIASTFTGPVALKAALKIHAKELGLDDPDYPDDIDLIVKLAQRSIYTHGFQEFIRNKTVMPIEERNFGVGKLFDGNDLSVVTKKTSVPEEVDKNKGPTLSEKVIAATNFSDALDGTNWESFVKYNNLYSIEVIIGKISSSNRTGTAPSKSVGEYITQNLLASFNDNINMDSRQFLKRLSIDKLEERILFNTEVKDTIVSICNGEPENVSGLINNEDKDLMKSKFHELEELRLQLSFHYKETMTTEKEASLQGIKDRFDDQITEFMQSVHTAVKNTIPTNK